MNLNKSVNLITVYFLAVKFTANVGNSQNRFDVILVNIWVSNFIFVLSGISTD